MDGPDRRRIFIFQEGGVFPWLTVRENIGFGLDRIPWSQRDGVIHHYVEMVGLTGSSGLTLANSRAACDSGSRSPVPWPRTPRSSTWTSRSAPRLHHPVQDARRPRADLGSRAQDDSVCHPRHRRGGSARRSRSRHEPPAGDDPQAVEIDLPRPRDLNSPAYLQRANRSSPRWACLNTERDPARCRPPTPPSHVPSRTTPTNPLRASHKQRSTVDNSNFLLCS